MFDPDTVRLITGAPPLEGLDLEALPRTLTRAYAEVVAARIRMREMRERVAVPELVTIAAQMRRLAATQEALLAVDPLRENRASAAFVAGSAHHVAAQVARLASNTVPASTIGVEGVSSEVSASLLFLIADATADAAEVSKSINIDLDRPVEAALLGAIVDLSQGHLADILGREPARLDLDSGLDISELALQALHLELLLGCKALAGNLLGEDLPGSSKSAEGRFRDVQALCIEPLQLEGEAGGTHYSVFAGPHHLATLLRCISRDLPGSAASRIPPPDGVDANRWRQFCRHIAKTRPYLWKNHRQAIATGYLTPGRSAAISFPTGAGKSTLTELKIASALLRGVKVLFLAPTLALVDQTAKALEDAFPQFDVERERAESSVLDAEFQALPTASVMTPERCLAMLGFEPSAFADVGLLVFDECHLLHPRDSDRSRRSIDAMLTLLHFIQVAAAADIVLLSAMMKNATEIAGWIGELTGRPCESLDITWKPTRQVRGCVVYEAKAIQALRAQIEAVRGSSRNINAPSSLRQALLVRPYGFFALQQTWLSQARSDYALLPLLDKQVLLATGTDRSRNWYLTPNGNRVAASIAVASAARGIKTLVFAQTITWCNSMAGAMSEELGSGSVRLTSDERLLHAVAAAEMGGAEYLFLDVAPGGDVKSSAVSHHGLLLPSERHLHESLFKRKDGINAVVATSTLSQGMNLPSEVVIIGGDSRFNPDANRVERLEAHELLNAAGRAGRAGEGAHGFVLVVPSKVIHFEEQTSRIAHHWAELRTIFSQGDQCLEIEDPLAPLLDEIQAGALPLSETAIYFLTRLPTSGEEESQAGASTRQLLSRTLAAYRARRAGVEADIFAKIDAVVRARLERPQLTTVAWVHRMAASAGIREGIILELYAEMTTTRPLEDTVSGWRDWVLAWLDKRPELVPELIRRECLEGFFGSAYKRLASDSERGRFALPLCSRLLALWMEGKPLADLERTVRPTASNLGMCESAREFVLRVVPELAYIFGLPAEILRNVLRESESLSGVPIVAATLRACVREGLSSPEHVAIRALKKRAFSRIRIHKEFLRIRSHLAVGPSEEDFGKTMSRVEDAIEWADIDDLLR